MKKIITLIITVFVLVVATAVGVDAYKGSKESWDYYKAEEAETFLIGDSEKTVTLLEVKYNKDGQPYYFFQTEGGKVQVAHPDQTKTIWSYMDFLKNHNQPTQAELDEYWTWNWESDTSIQNVDWK